MLCFNQSTVPAEYHWYFKTYTVLYSRIGDDMGERSIIAHENDSFRFQLQQPVCVLRLWKLNQPNEAVESVELNAAKTMEDPHSESGNGLESRSSRRFR
jgi:hypothetical protein